MRFTVSLTRSVAGSLTGFMTVTRSLCPQGTWHNVISPSSSSLLKRYTLYAPPNHAKGVVHRTKADAEAAEP